MSKLLAFFFQNQNRNQYQSQNHIIYSYLTNTEQHINDTRGKVLLVIAVIVVGVRFVHQCMCVCVCMRAHVTCVVQCMCA